ncbi:DUF4185 domain-containing protein [Mycolicibacterium celeriflavum]|uniref:DUF4185 domain-containing protein n=1 Tax=Mycolicibacterium celeriflavum TaxID=1249101 RepID=A0A7I7RBU6_MYCCF|nr:DUF4185 domain-containing protein [Mycolicibacterium celeriflavum]BBY42008.1 hypothetical protein MCEL_03030 [Mycolicibacterium celeriflavum]
MPDNPSIGRAAGHRLRPTRRARLPLLNGKAVDLTGPGLTDRWGVTCTDLGASVIAPNGKLVSVFGDTFSGRKVGQGDWRSPVVLIGTGDADHEIVYERAGGSDPDYARQLWHYVHDDAGTGWRGSGISTVIPSDLLTVGDSMYLHVIVNRGFGAVVWTEIWRSPDSGVTWTHLGEKAKFPADLHNGHAQCWAWDFDPDDGWVYVAATGFQRDKGIVLMRVRPEHIGDRTRYRSWGFAEGRWAWGTSATPVTPAGERWGELAFRRIGRDKWVLGGFLASKYALGYRVVASPVANMHTTPIQMPVVGSAWDAEDHFDSRVAQLYGGYLLPGSRFDIDGGVGLVVSQWHTASGWPYRAMQFKVGLRDTSRRAQADANGPEIL